MLIIQASNIHQGGGRVLLEELLRSVSEQKFILLIDERFDVRRLALSTEIFEIKPSLLGRIKSEFLLRQLAHANPKATVLCFGNLPPLFAIKNKTILFFQNVILLKRFSKFTFSRRVQLRQFIERLWLRWRMKNINKVIVQTPTVRAHFQEEFSKIPVVVCPYFGKELSSFPSTEKIYDFVYVSSGDPHKNHTKLLEAWALLAGEGLTPSLALTVGFAYPEVLLQIAQAQNKSLKIQNIQSANRDEILSLYQVSRAAIFPSLCESFGLPLLEAQAYQLPVLAPELDYVRDLIVPDETFDPQSARSIARAVRRHLGKAETPVLTNSVHDFIDTVMS